MQLKKQPLLVLSLDEQKRLSSFFELLIAIDKRVKASRSKEKKSYPRSRKNKSEDSSSGKEIRQSSLKKRTFLLLAFLCFIKLIYFITNPRCSVWHTYSAIKRHS